MDIFLSTKAVPSEAVNRHFSLFAYGLIIAIWMTLLGVKNMLEPAHYQTVDGDYYMQLAEKIRDGKPYLLDGLKNEKGLEFSPYPPGFPLLLALFSGAGTAIPCHILVHGFLFSILAFFWWIHRLPLFVFAILLFQDTALEICSYPWSEGAFVAISILLVIAWQRWEAGRKIIWFFAVLLLWLFLFSIRYAAVFFFLFMAYRLVFAPSWISRRKTMILPSLFFLLLVGMWFLVEWQLFGQITGGDRYANHNQPAELIDSLFGEVLNQLLWFKDVTGSSDISFYSGLSVQFFLVFWFVFFLRRKEKNELQIFSSQASLGGMMMQCGMAYLLFIIPLRWHFYFAELYDFRLLGPGFLVLFSGILLYADALFWFKNRFWITVVFLVFAVLFSIPKASLFLRFQEKIWLDTKPVFTKIITQVKTL